MAGECLRKRVGIVALVSTTEEGITDRYSRAPAEGGPEARKIEDETEPKHESSTDHTQKHHSQRCGSDEETFIPGGLQETDAAEN